MKNVFARFFPSLPIGARWLLLCYGLGYPLALVGNYSRTVDLYEWLGLIPALVWKGQVWRLITYAFLPNGIVDWVVSLFWLATLVSVLGRNWSWRELWGYTLLSTVVGALLILGLVRPWSWSVGNGAMIFGMLAAWYRLYGRERLLLLGFGEISVRQAAILIALIETLILFFSFGGLVTLSLMSGGVVGWCYLAARRKTAMNRRSQVIDSERIARLEL